MSLIKFKHQNPNWTAIDNLFNDFFEGEFTSRKISKTATVPSANIAETEHRFQIELAIPGKKKEEFQIELDEDLLSVSVETSDHEKEDSKKYNNREFDYTRFKRSFRIPELANKDEVGANYKDGILTIIIPKLEIEETTKKREIAIS